MSRLGFALAATVVAASVATPGVLLGVGRAQQPAEDPADRKIAQSQALRLEAEQGRTESPRFVAGVDARQAAAQYAASVPLPEGGNFNGIQWERAPGTLAIHEIRGALAYNAACQWLRASSAGGEEAPLARRILGDIPSWPVLRGTEAGGVLDGVAADVRSGRASEAVAGVLEDCRRSHEREVAYAVSLGLVPST